MKFRTRAIHDGNSIDPQTGAVVPPIHLASTFRQPGAGEWGEFDYSRSGNPTRSNLQATLNSLEGAVGSLAFSSGMAATHCVTMLLGNGDHVVAGKDIYGGTYRLLHKICDRNGISVTLVDMTDLDAVAAAIQPNTKLLWAETIGNPLFSIPNLTALAELAHSRGALIGVDNTFGTPVLVRPLEFGIDIVMHSATKYLGGHSDCLGGTLSVADKELYDRLYFVQNATGAVLDPFSSFLIGRGLKTLDVRIREQSKTAARLADWLAAHPRVSRVYYPGLTSHPGHELAARQFDGIYGAMLGFELAGDFKATAAMVGKTHLFHLAVSLGAVESLIEQPASMSHASYDPADRAKAGISDALVRLSVGLEDFDDLRQDIEQAIESV
ncbi:Cystathionine gamma-lyase [Rosistilla oblonga]|uniref:Cystathionine gamma-lyase n=1 Tax=Rosistilla oblonga TaxID=2527990 RepID=A0A518ITD0_9BACT|nr:PLP-dependent aspartate aminotransferase family protein [Rosistilla oblonga]QDV12302.1 Cystathionine gamma-lyase [Rosistilla oblonga]QDV56341.1 Cystathionine gamma-lyase [Rosistilla oblonga]